MQYAIKKLSPGTANPVGASNDCPFLEGHLQLHVDCSLESGDESGGVKRKSSAKAFTGVQGTFYKVRMAVMTEQGCTDWGRLLFYSE